LARFNLSRIAQQMISGSSFLFGSFVMGSSMSFTMDYSVDTFTSSSMLDQIQFMKNLLASSEEADVVITYLQLFNQLYKDRKEVMISNSMFNDRVLIERLMKRIGFVSSDNLDVDHSQIHLQLQVASESTHAIGLLAREGNYLIMNHAGLFLAKSRIIFLFRNYRWNNNPVT
jgi:hypothetical protein